MADSKISALSEISVPAIEDLLAIVDDPSGTPVSNKVTAGRLGGLLGRGVCEGRLTLTSNTPVTTSDVTAAGTLYFTPYGGNLVSVYDGTRWKLYAFSQLSLSLTLTSGKPYDIWIYDNAGTLTLEALVWTDDTTRATALAFQDGVYVKNGDATRRYLGSIYASGTNTTEDSLAKRFVWNYYNRVDRPLAVLEATNSWTLNATALRQGNNSAANQIDTIVGVAEDAIEVNLQVGFDGPASGQGAVVGIGVSSVAAVHAYSTGYAMSSGTAMARIRMIPAVGRYYYTWIEATQTTGGNVTYYGDAGAALSATINSGIFGVVRG